MSLALIYKVVSDHGNRTSTPRSSPERVTGTVPMSVSDHPFGEYHMYYYRDGTPIPELDEHFPDRNALVKWAEHWRDNKQVALDRVGEHSVSTVFLGVNHNFVPGPPLIFETMIFGSGGASDYCCRYTTEEQAREGHERACHFARAGLAGREDWEWMDDAYREIPNKGEGE